MRVTLEGVKASDCKRRALASKPLTRTGQDVEGSGQKQTKSHACALPHVVSVALKMNGETSTVARTVSQQEISEEINNLGHNTRGV